MLNVQIPVILPMFLLLLASESHIAHCTVAHENVIIAISLEEEIAALIRTELRPDDMEILVSQNLTLFSL